MKVVKTNMFDDDAAAAPERVPLPACLIATTSDGLGGLGGWVPSSLRVQKAGKLFDFGFSQEAPPLIGESLVLLFDDTPAPRYSWIESVE